MYHNSGFARKGLVAKKGKLLYAASIAIISGTHCHHTHIFWKSLADFLWHHIDRC